MHSDDAVKEAATHKLHSLGTNHLASLSNITINVALNHRGGCMLMMFISKKWAATTECLPGHQLG